MARFTENEQDRMAGARVNAFEQIAEREQAADVDSETLNRRAQAARAQAVRTLRTVRRTRSPARSLGSSGRSYGGVYAGS